MAARKGIRAKILARFVAGEQMTGRQIEKAYIEYGGSAPGGRVSWDTIRHLVSSLPIIRIEKKKFSAPRSLMRDKFKLDPEKHEAEVEHAQSKVIQKDIWTGLLRAVQ